MDDEGIAADAADERGEDRALREGRLVECACGVAVGPDDIATCAGCTTVVCDDCAVREGPPSKRVSYCADCAEEREEDARDP